MSNNDNFKSQRRLGFLAGLLGGVVRTEAAAGGFVGGGVAEEVAMGDFLGDASVEAETPAGAFF